jgi:hypothetical protein
MRFQGRTIPARGYCVRAVATSGLIAERRTFIAEMKVNMKEGKKIPVPAAKPDREKLEQIVIMCAKSRLFSDAFETLRQIEQLKEKPAPSTLKILHEEILSMIPDMCRGFYDGVEFRDIKISDESTVKERELIKQLEKEIAERAN